MSESPPKFITKSYNPGPIKYEPCPQIMTDLAAFLQERDHTCVSIVGLTDHKFEWCGKDICPSKLIWDDMDKRQAEEMAFAKKLESEGHTCVYYMESYPVQIGWCDSAVCTRPRN
jgi:hypothetical protein